MPELMVLISMPTAVVGRTCSPSSRERLVATINVVVFGPATMELATVKGPVESLCNELSRGCQG